jgi:hypothetical protein
MKLTAQAALAREAALRCRRRTPKKRTARSGALRHFWAAGRDILAANAKDLTEALERA